MQYMKEIKTLGIQGKVTCRLDRKSIIKIHVRPQGALASHWPLDRLFNGFVGCHPLKCANVNVRDFLGNS
jgi:hypothetical protein